jgi:hypothetical protein
MNAYLIDPFKAEITEVNYSGDYKEIYELIDCQYFDCVNLGDSNDSVFIDDEGLINGKEQEFFRIKGYPNPLAGYGLVLGVDEEGNSTDPKTSFKDVENMITFVNPIELFLRGYHELCRD